MGCVSSRQKADFKTDFPPPSRPAHEVESEERVAAMAQRAKEAREVAERAAEAERRAAERAALAEKNAAVKAAEALEAQARADAQVQREAELKLKKMREKAEDDAYEAAVKQAFIDGADPPPPPEPRFTPSTKMLEVPPVKLLTPPAPAPPAFTIARDPVVAARASIFEPQKTAEPKAPAPAKKVGSEKAAALVKGFEERGDAASVVEKQSRVPGKYTPHAPNGQARNLRARFEGRDRAPMRADPSAGVPSPGAAVAKKLAGYEAREAAARTKPTLRPVQPASAARGISSQLAGYEARDAAAAAGPTGAAEPHSPGAGVASKLHACEERDAAASAKPALRSVEHVDQGRGIARQLAGYEARDAARDAAAADGPTGAPEAHSPGADVASKMAGYDALEAAANETPQLRNVAEIEQGYNGISSTRAEYERRDAEAAKPLPPPANVAPKADGEVADAARAYERLERSASAQAGHHDVGAIEHRQMKLYEKAGLPVSPVTPERGLRPLSIPKFADPVLEGASPVKDTRALFERTEEVESFDRPQVPVEAGRARRVAGMFTHRQEATFAGEKVDTGVSRSKLLNMLSAYEAKDEIARQEMAVQDVSERIRVAEATRRAVQAAE